MLKRSPLDFAYYGAAFRRCTLPGDLGTTRETGIVLTRSSPLGFLDLGWRSDSNSSLTTSESGAALWCSPLLFFDFGSSGRTGFANGRGFPSRGVGEDWEKEILLRGRLLGNDVETLSTSDVEIPSARSSEFAYIGTKTIATSRWVAGGALLKKYISCADEECSSCPGVTQRMPLLKLVAFPGLLSGGPASAIW